MLKIVVVGVGEINVNSLSSAKLIGMEAYGVISVFLNDPVCVFN